MDCISHLSSRCLAILIPSSERLRSDLIKTSVAFACSAGEGTPSHLSHVKFPAQLPCAQCTGSECPWWRLKGCHSHGVIKPYAPGTSNGLLTNSVHVIKYCSFGSLWPSPHLCPPHLVYQACLKINNLKMCLVLQKKPREAHYLCCVCTFRFFC